MIRIENPWMSLPAVSPYVAAGDREEIEPFNRRASAEVAIHTELLPEPFFGREDAPIVLLALNPGFSPDDVATHAREDFRAACQKNLRHEPSDFPFVYLDPRFETTPGGGWWLRKLTPLLDAGVERRTLANRLLCVFPVPLETYKPLRRLLESQHYGFFLVDAAVRRGATIIDMRSSAMWSNHVPSLASHARRFD